jgi:hypothetical protein
MRGADHLLPLAVEAAHRTTQACLSGSALPMPALLLVMMSYVTLSA